VTLDGAMPSGDIELLSIERRCHFSEHFTRAEDVLIQFKLLGKAGEMLDGLQS
jgi:hypothetical protein